MDVSSAQQLQAASTRDSRRAWSLGFGIAAILSVGLFVGGCAGLASQNVSGGGSNTAGTPQLRVVPSTINFSSVPVGQQNTQTVQLSNAGTGTLTVQTIAVSGSGFSVSTPTLPVSIVAGASQNVTVAFQPTSTNSSTGTLMIGSNDPSSPASVPLQGSGQATSANLQLNPASVSFGNTTVGTTNFQGVSLQNTGNVSVTVNSVVLAGATFGVVGLASGLTLTPQQQTSFQVTFQPTAIGSVSGTVTIAGSGLSSALSLPMSGVGQSASTTSHSVTLNWSPSTSSVAGYYVYRGGASGGPYSRVNFNQAGVTAFTDANVSGGSTYYYVVTAVDSSGAESGYSNEVSAQIPTP